MILSGQNQYWGNIEEATQFWLGVGINHLMIKREKDIQLIDQNGKLIEKDFEKLSELQNKYSVKYHIHPYSLIVQDIFLTPSLKSSHSILNQFLTDLDKKIYEYELYPLITLHLAIFDHPKYHFDLDEKRALKNSLTFFQNLNLKSKLDLEVMHAPYRNPGHALLGYKAEHFLKLIGNKKFGLCIDTGHLKMTEEPFEKFLKLPYPIYSIHLHGNNGDQDEHQLPTQKNVGDFKKVIKAFKKCEGLLVFEIANHNYHYSKNEVKKCVKFWKKFI